MTASNVRKLATRIGLADKIRFAVTVHAASRLRLAKPQLHGPPLQAKER
jgi:hypothetical protein